ncbi:Clavaminate synthase-like protein [Nemania abortiva]|nr:Clavaminate synthase-like protein [Nemania abortiva]
MHRMPYGPLRTSKSLAASLKRPRCIASAYHGSYQPFDYDAPTPWKPPMAFGGIDVDTFRRRVWENSTPVHLRGFHQLPAMERWFIRSDRGQESATFSKELELVSGAPMPYELMTWGGRLGSPSAPSSTSSSSCVRHFQAWLSRQPAKQDNALLGELVERLLGSLESCQSGFLRFDGPLGLIIQAARYNESTDSPEHRLRNLYIAQCDIPSLPATMVEDLPVPEVVRKVGKGDVYASSIWLGLQPTYTPLHRDPNPNLFCQLVGSKAVRIMEPEDGLSVFQEVRKRLGVPGNPRIRGPDMMHGPERDELHRAVWVQPSRSRVIWECVLGPGDAMFIPQGWWHSFWSVGNEAEVNASANWWFR